MGAIWPAMTQRVLAALLKVSGVLDTGLFLADIEKSYQNKFADKPQMISGNMESLKQSLREVREG